MQPMNHQPEPEKNLGLPPLEGSAADDALNSDFFELKTGAASAESAPGGSAEIGRDNEASKKPEPSPDLETPAGKESAKEAHHASLDIEHPHSTAERVAKVAVESMAKHQMGSSDWSLIVQSAAAGTVSVLLTLPACEIATRLYAPLADPALNAGLGVLFSTITYVPTFIGISLYRAREAIKACEPEKRAGMVKDHIVHGLKFLGLQEFCEYSARYAMHFGLMMAGMPAWSAFMIASGVTGFLGRLATPWFSRLFKKKESPDNPQQES